jgi:hypothetical protein
VATEWTVSTLKTLMDSQMQAHEELDRQRHAETDRVLSAYVVTVNDRLVQLNELRSEVITDRGQFLQRDIYDTHHSELTAKVEQLLQFKARATGTAVVLALFASVVGGALVKAFGL